MIKNDSDVILGVDGVWKKYCRHLKRALWYGVRDIGRQFWNPDFENAQPKLRPGEFYSIKDMSFEIRRGECVGLIGPNGAGKSTILKLINGLLRPDAGEIRIRGRTGALIELGTGFNPVLSGRENVYVNAAVLGLSKREVDLVFDDIVSFAELGHVINDPVKTYSSGMNVRLGFSVAAHLHPELLIMDEVLAVGDTGFRMKCFKHLNELAANGTSILLVTHAVGMLPRVCSRAIVLNQGAKVFDGDIQKGIAVYEECQVPVEQVPKTQLATKKADAKIVSAQVFDLAGNPVSEIQTGDSIKLKLVVHCDRPMRSANVIVNLGSPRVETIASISSNYKSFRPDLQPGPHHFEIELRDLPLLVGGYFFTISLYGETVYDFVDRLTGCGAFQVIGPPIDASGNGLTGLLQLEHDWQ